MYKFPIGFLMESLKVESDREAIETAVSMGVKGMQLHAVRGDKHTPEAMTAEKKKGAAFSVVI